MWESEQIWALISEVSLKFGSKIENKSKDSVCILSKCYDNLKHRQHKECIKYVKVQKSII